MTTAEQLRSEGRLEGRRETLLAQLTVKFGPLPAELARKVREADEAALQRWAVNVVTTETVDAVFAEAER